MSVSSDAEKMLSGFDEVELESIDKSKFELLLRDYTFCKQLKTNHLNPDLKELVDRISDVFEDIIKNHLIDLKLNKWYNQKLDDPLSIRQKADHLCNLLSELYLKEISEDTGTINQEILPKRSNLISQFILALRKNGVSNEVIVECNSLLHESLVFHTQLFHNLQVISSLNSSKLVSEESRAQTARLISSLINPIESYFEILVKLVNKISFVDSLTNQLTSEVYTIEHHIVKELDVRSRIMDAISKGESRISAGSFQVLFLRKDSSDLELFSRQNIDFKLVSFNELEVMADVKDPSKVLFDGVKRFDQLRKLLFAIKFQDPSSKSVLSHLLKEFSQDIQSKILACTSESDFNSFFDKTFFFNRSDFFIVMKDNHNSFSCINSPNVFLNSTLQFLIFHHFKNEGFDRLINSIVEPFFLNPIQLLSFTNFRSARLTSFSIVKKVLDKELGEGDLTQSDYAQILRFMERGYSELTAAQDGVASELHPNSKTRPKYHRFVTKPYLVHQLMMDILRLAIFAEGRAKVNINDDKIYTGRESGFEGGNTVAVHGFNNFLKYQAVMKLISPVLAKNSELLDHFEHFRSWLLMAMHDAATYDRQNGVVFSSQMKFQNDNKKAHKIIGAYIIREHEILKKLFDIVDDDGVEKDSEEKVDLDLLAAVVVNHDYGQLHFDLGSLGTTNPQVIKSLVCFSVSGIADNSAGVGFLDENNKAHVDPWEEKGSSIFSVPGNEPYFFEILRNLAKNKKFYSDNPLEWSRIVSIVQRNIQQSSISEIVRNKLLAGMPDFSNPSSGTRSATSTAGVLNAGFMRFKSYDGVTLNLEIVMDSAVNKMFMDIFGKGYVESFADDKNPVFGRLIKFLSEYKKVFESDAFSKLMNKREVLIYNSDKSGKKLESIGLHIKVVEESNVLNTHLIEEESKALLGELEKLHDKYTLKV